MVIVLISALLLDYFFSEPGKYHPLKGILRLAKELEGRLNDDIHAHQNRVNGIIAALVIIVPAWWLVDYIVSDSYLGFVLEIIILYLAIGLNGLKALSRKVLDALKRETPEEAKQILETMNPREDVDNMNQEDIARSTTESVLEYANDAIFGVLFWYLIAGAPGVVVYRLVNSLDALWTVREERYENFGFFVRRLDELLNYIPARLTALSYAMMGDWVKATCCWSKQGLRWDSPNSGVIMSAGAGALGVQIGGCEMTKKGERKDLPELGEGHKANPETIEEACQLLNRSTLLWTAAFALMSMNQIL